MRDLNAGGGVSSPHAYKKGQAYSTDAGFYEKKLETEILRTRGNIGHTTFLASQ